MPSVDPKPRTLYDKVFESHIVDERSDGTILLYIGMIDALYFITERGLTREQIDIWFMK